MIKKIHYLLLTLVLIGCTKAIEYEPVDIVPIDRLEPTNLERASVDVIKLFDEWKSKTEIYKCDSGEYQVWVMGLHKREFKSLSEAHIGAELWALEMAEFEIELRQQPVKQQPCGTKIK